MEPEDTNRQDQGHIQYCNQHARDQLGKYHLSRASWSSQQLFQSSGFPFAYDRHGRISNKDDLHDESNQARQDENQILDIRVVKHPGDCHNRQ